MDYPPQDDGYDDEVYGEETDDFSHEGDESANPCHEWENIWGDGVGQCCLVCLMCGEERIFQYEPEEGADVSPE